uniref:hypothetical protein n=1 Tax=Pseudomonas aeruginosa TaxID=287 RepID=UPI00094702C4
MSDTGQHFSCDISEDDEGLLPPDESLDPDELDDDFDELGYSPLDRPSGNLSWGFTAREARTSEPLSVRLARELPDVGADLDDDEGDDLGDVIDTDGELRDDEVASARAGRLVWAEPESSDPEADYWESNLHIDGGAATTAQVAVHVID